MYTLPRKIGRKADTDFRCDADPNALADYVEALLKHDATMNDEEWKIVRLHEAMIRKVG
jgi:hypothetical protein